MVSDPSLLRFRAVVEGALDALEARRQEVNDLNVFPVADGDTGDNMALTLRAVLIELDRLASLGEIDEIGREQIVQSVARAALLGALLFLGFVVWFWRGVLPPPHPTRWVLAGKLAVAAPLAADEAGVPHLDEDVLQELQRDPLRLGDPVSLHGALVSGKLHRRPHGIVRLR